jgi:hypothetical protein
VLVNNNSSQSAIVTVNTPSPQQPFPSIPQIFSASSTQSYTNNNPQVVPSIPIQNPQVVPSIPIQNPPTPVQAVPISPAPQIGSSFIQGSCASNPNTYWTGYTCACRVGYTSNDGICVPISVSLSTSYTIRPS